MPNSQWSDLSRPPLSQARLRRALERDDTWRQIDVVEATESTNADVAVAARTGAPEGLVLVAEHQTAGRGRLDRRWESPPRAGLMLSVLIRPHVEVGRWGLIPLLAGLAVVEAVSAVGYVEAALKWPNDVLVDDLKLGGLLVELAADGAVVGIGLNVSTRADELPVSTATSMLIAGGTTDREPLLKELLRAGASLPSVVRRRRRPGLGVTRIPRAMRDDWRRGRTGASGGRRRAWDGGRCGRHRQTGRRGRRHRRTACLVGRRRDTRTEGVGTVAMGFPENILDEDEHVIRNLRPHWRKVAGPVVLLPIVVGLASYGWFSLPDDSARKVLRWVILAAALVILLWWSVRPFLFWLTTRYVVTDRRVLMRHGVLARTGRDVPLTRVNDVSFSRSVVERLFGSGTLVIESAGDRGQVSLTDVPHVETVQREIYKLVEDEAQRLR